MGLSKKFGAKKIKNTGLVLKEKEINLRREFWALDRRTKDAKGRRKMVLLSLVSFGTMVQRRTTNAIQWKA